MMNKEEKSLLLDKTIDEMKKVMLKARQDKESMREGPYKLMEALDPLMQEYNKELMEVINPINPRLKPVLIYCFKSTLADLERDMELVDIALLRMIEGTYTSASVAIPYNER